MKQHTDTYVPLASWDNESTNNDQFDEGNVYSDNEDTGSLVRQPRQVCFFTYQCCIPLFHFSLFFRVVTDTVFLYLCLEGCDPS